MITKLLSNIPKSSHLLFLLFMMMSINSFADIICGSIEGFEFSNGHESVNLIDGQSYLPQDLPDNFYVNLKVDGYSQSVRYVVENIETGEVFKITENSKPYTFPAGNSKWDLGNGTFRLKATLYKLNLGFGKCDTKTIVFTISNECLADSGSLMADMDMVTLVDGTATISATVKDAPFVPSGYANAYVLTKGEGLVIQALGGEPSFEVTEAGMYTIHSIVFNPDTLDTNIVVPGQTTGFDVFGLIIPGGGSICASLDVAGAPVTVTECLADSGSLMADMDMVTLVDGTATISATVKDAPFVPSGYANAYVLTKGEGLVIQALGGEPSFEVTEAGMYTIHSIVFNPDTLDTNIVVPGQTTGFDVFGLIIPGGGSICASLDVAGAPVTVTECLADSGSLMADMDMVTLVDGTATISATIKDAPFVPSGYANAYVLTKGEGLVIQALGGEPSFEVTEAGMYTIHSIVFNPDTLDTNIVVPGQTTGFDVFGLIIPGGGSICASLDVAGAPVTVTECLADSGSLMADMDMVTLVDGTATISATIKDAPFVPSGYANAYVLTKGEGLVIQALGGEPSFEVTEAGMYTIHSIVFNPDTLDTNIVVPGQTTGFDVFGLIIPGGGSICASLDVAGAPVTVTECLADSGSLMADMDMVTLVDGTATISATIKDAPFVPSGYANAYVLTKGEGLVIQALGGEPSFEVTEAGMYTIHSIVFNPDTLDTNIVVPGQTTGFDVFGLIIPGGGSICASLDVAGAPVTVTECLADSGSLMADMDMVTLVDGTATISATIKDAPFVPSGYANAYVLTKGEGLVIQALGGEPSFEVTEAGMYTIHSIVFNPDTLDTNIVVPGQTTGFDVFGLIIPGGGSICASLDVAGAPVTVTECLADSGSLMADMDMVTLVDGTATISATIKDAPFVPSGYANAYVLTKGEGLVIQALGGEPSFEVTEAGMYTIHSIVFNPDTLDTNIVVPGQTTGFDVFGLIIPGGGSICASLDVAGAPVTVTECLADSGSLMADMDMVTLVDGTATISATIKDAPFVPSGYANAYVLTKGEGLVIQALGGEPSFEVTEAGMYTIHSIVFNPDTLDTNIVVPGQTTGFDVFGLIIPGGGSICASLDVAGAPVTVTECLADSGSLMADMDMVTLVDGTATISATIKDAPFVPSGYANAYVLTKGEGLVIQALGGEPSFEVTEAGMYTIHSIVFNPDTLDTNIVVPGQTTGFDVFGLIIPGGGSICASLDVAGAPVTVEEESCVAYSGTLYSTETINCLVNGSTVLTAQENETALVPKGYEQLFVLTNAFTLTILDVSSTPSFEVNKRGFYRIHSLVYNPNTLDLSIVVPGQTTGFDVVNLISDNGICASLDVKGAVNLVIGSRWFCYFFNKYFNKSGGVKDISGKGTNNNSGLDDLVNSYNSYDAFKNDFIASNGDTKFYPNPVINTLNVEVELLDDETMNYSVIDIQGRRVMSGAANNLEFGSQVIDASRLNTGMYLVQFVSEYRTITKKIVVKK
jgi:hypothetical protein